MNSLDVVRRAARFERQPLSVELMLFIVEVHSLHIRSKVTDRLVVVVVVAVVVVVVVIVVVMVKIT